jgi:thiol-disulfide isomerase/thioredoxin
MPPEPPPGTYQPAVPVPHGGTVVLPPGHQAAGTSATDPLYGSFVGAAPPALGRDGKWLVPGVASTLEGMRGQVVFLMFAFQTCPSCAQMTPYMRQWHDMYGPQGLSVVYVNNGRMASEADATKAIRDQGLRFAYLHDAEGSSLQAFSIRAFPTAYVIDRSGKVVWEGTPLAVESQVQELLVGLLAPK